MQPILAAFPISYCPSHPLTPTLHLPGVPIERQLGSGSIQNPSHLQAQSLIPTTAKPSAASSPKPQMAARAVAITASSLRSARALVLYAWCTSQHQMLIASIHKSVVSLTSPYATFLFATEGAHLPATDCTEFVPVCANESSSNAARTGCSKH